MGFLNPFAINHSAIELRIGAITNFDRIKLIYPSANFILVVSPHLKKIIKERFPDYQVNPEIIPKGICLNARAIFKKEHVGEPLNCANTVAPSSDLDWLCKQSMYACMCLCLCVCICSRMPAMPATLGGTPLMG